MAFWKPTGAANPNKRKPDRGEVGVEWLTVLRTGRTVQELETIPAAGILARLAGLFPDAVQTQPNALDCEHEGGAWTAHGYPQGIEVILWDDTPDDVLNALLGVAEEFGLEPFSYPQ
jgi:hypothetical protein